MDKVIFLSVLLAGCALGQEDERMRSIRPFHRLNETVTEDTFTGIENIGIDLFNNAELDSLGERLDNFLNYCPELEAEDANAHINNPFRYIGLEVTSICNEGFEQCERTPTYKCEADRMWVKDGTSNCVDSALMYRDNVVAKYYSIPCELPFGSVLHFKGIPPQTTEDWGITLQHDNDNYVAHVTVKSLESKWMIHRKVNARWELSVTFADTVFVAGQSHVVDITWTPTGLQFALDGVTVYTDYSYEGMVASGYRLRGEAFESVSITLPNL